MYTLAGLYLLAPLLSPFLERASRRELELYLGLWGVSLCYPLLRIWLQVDENTTGILYYFTGYAGYFLLGHYLKRYGERVGWGLAIGGMVTALAAAGVFRLSGIKGDCDGLFWYLSIFVVAMCLFWWKAVTALVQRVHLSEAAVRRVTLVSNLSFGIYLSHIFFMRRLFWELPPIADIPVYILQWLAVAVLTFASSFAFSWIVSRLPIGNSVIGYRRKKQ